MSIEIVPTNAALGAEVRGVDLARPPDDATFRNRAGLRRVWRHLLSRSADHATATGRLHPPLW